MRWRAPADRVAYRRAMLEAQPLLSPRRFLWTKAIAVGYAVAWGASLFAAVAFIDGAWKFVAVGVLIVFTPTIDVSELRQRYADYKAEWLLVHEGSRDGGVVGR
jgi:hypothetical protein